MDHSTMCDDNCCVSLFDCDDQRSRKNNQLLF
jgi:hypothetical protein